MTQGVRFYERRNGTIGKRHTYENEEQRLQEMTMSLHEDKGKKTHSIMGVNARIDEERKRNNRSAGKQK